MGAAEGSRSGRSRRVTEVVIGACIGLTWAAALRAYMIELAGAESAFHWYGTFGAVLLPGAIAGAGIALARQRQTRGAPRPWLPSLGLVGFGVLPLLHPGAIQELVTTGIGGGAIGVVAALLLGGFGLGDHGARLARGIALAASALLSVGVAATVPTIGGAEHALTTARGVWGTTLALGLMATGSLATALAFRRRPAEAS